MQLASLYAAQGKTQDVEATYRQAAAIAPQDLRPSLALGGFYAAAHRSAAAAYQHAITQPRMPQSRDCSSLKCIYARTSWLRRHSTLTNCATRPMATLLAAPCRGAWPWHGSNQPRPLLSSRRSSSDSPLSPQRITTWAWRTCKWQSPVGSQRLDRGHAAGASVCRTTCALASLYLQTREFSLVIEAAQKVPQIQPHHTQGAVTSGQSLPGQRRRREGANHLQDRHGPCPRDPAGYYYLGLGYRAQKQEGQALQAFEKALSLNPNLIDALAQVVEVYMTRKEPAKALARVRTQLHTAPQRSPPLQPARQHLPGPAPGY